MLIVDSKILFMNKNIKNSDIDSIEKWLRNKRPPEEIRPKLDYTYFIQRNTFILCEVRPDWRTMKDWKNIPFAKIHYLKSEEVYKIYWQRGSGKWIYYEPVRETESLADALNVINEDTFGCFYG